jgi:hypothetical protein
MSLAPGLESLIRWSRSSWRRYRRRREAACLRCGRPARATCRACGARVCDRCWLLSIETGAAAVLCIDCTARSGHPGHGFAGSEPVDLLRHGAKVVGWSLAALALWSYARSGWSGLSSFAALVLQPAVTLSLVPLAFLLGAARMVALRALRALLSRSASRSP